MSSLQPRQRIHMSQASDTRLVIFDLDGTLLRGMTSCELIADRIGMLDQMRAFEMLTGEEEIGRARTEMLGWYRSHDRSQLLEALNDATLAPRVTEGLELLRRNRFQIAIASITWAFAVEHIAAKLKVEHRLGTGCTSAGEIDHVWPRHKSQWSEELADRLGIPKALTAAVGDSRGDIPLLQSVACPVFVGASLPDGLDATHLPGSDIMTVAEHIVAHFSSHH
jgi:phosphoserine phosphatase